MSRSIRFITQQWTLNHIITCLSKTTWWPHIIMPALLLPWRSLPDKIILTYPISYKGSITCRCSRKWARTPWEGLLIIWDLQFRYMRGWGISLAEVYTSFNNEKSKDYCKADLKQTCIVFYNNISAGHTSLLQVYRCYWTYVAITIDGKCRNKNCLKIKVALVIGHWQLVIGRWAPGIGAYRTRQ